MVLHFGVGAGCFDGVVGTGADAVGFGVAVGAAAGVPVAVVTEGAEEGGGAVFLGAGGARRLVAEMGGGVYPVSSNLNNM